MNIQLNGEKRYISDQTTLLQLLQLEKVTSIDSVSVQKNGEFVEKDLFETTDLAEGDEIDFLYFMGGGSL